MTVRIDTSGWDSNDVQELEELLDRVDAAQARSRLRNGVVLVSEEDEL